MANVALHELTDSWSGGGAFDAIKMSVTDGGSTADSKLLDLLVDSGSGAASKFKVDKAGNTTIAGTLGVTGDAQIAGLRVRGDIGGARSTNACIEITQGSFVNSRSLGSSKSVFIGHGVAPSVDDSLFENGSSCIGVGTLTLNALTTGRQNVAIGENALRFVQTGVSNTAVGIGAGEQATGRQNVFLGRNAGNTQTSGENNIFVGFSAQPDSVTDSYQINIGNRYFHNRLELKNAVSGAGDCILLRETANQLAMRNGTNPQTFRLYNTYSVEEGVTSYERGILAWGSNVLKLGTEKAGTGVARALELQTDGATRVSIGTGGFVGVGTSNPVCSLDVAGTLPELRMRGAATGTGPMLRLYYSRGTIASPTPVQPGDVSGEIGFAPQATSLLANSARIRHTVSAVWGTVCSGRLALETINEANGVYSGLYIVSPGKVGIGTTVPGRKLDVNDAAGNCLRLTYNDTDGSAANYADFLVSSSGDLTITPSGGDLKVTGRATIDGLTVGKGGQTTGTNNTAVGFEAINSATAGTDCTAVGAFALNSATGGGNLGIGVRALQIAAGGNNTALGNLSLWKTTSGSGNVALGGGALQENTTGNNNVAAGQASLASNTTGAGSVAVGQTALRYVVGSHNVAIGFESLFGGDATPANNTATQNVCIGSRAGKFITTGTNNVVVGYEIAPDSVTDSYQINIGNRYFHNRIELQAAASSPIAGDCILLREAANQLAMRNGTNPQTLRLYNTYTDGSNYERGFLRWDSDKLLLGTESLAAGVAGTPRAMELQTGGTTRLHIASTGELSVLHARNSLAMNITNANASSAPTFSLGVGFPGYYDNWLVLNSPGGVVFGIRNDTGQFNQYRTLALQTGSALVLAGGVHIQPSAVTGTKIGISTSAKIAFWNATPIVQPTTSHAEATFVENSGGTAVNDDSTFGGYTIGQVVKALQDVGLLA